MFSPRHGQAGGVNNQKLHAEDHPGPVTYYIYAHRHGILSTNPNFAGAANLMRIAVWHEYDGGSTAFQRFLDSPVRYV